MTQSLYSLHPGFAMEASSLANLQSRTGKTLDEWIEIVLRDGPASTKEREAWLKETHGFTANYALWVAGRASGERTADAYDPEGLVEAMFAGKKAALRPIYDALLAFGLGLGGDVKACPGSTIVPLYRRHVFAQLKPTTNTRLDLGLALRDLPGEGRLVETGGYAKKDRITHRLAIASLADFDDEARAWFGRAYELNC